MIKKNLRHLHAVVTKQTYGNLWRWAAEAGWGEKDLGRVIDRLARERALREGAARQENSRWKYWPWQKPEESGEYIVQIQGATQATTLWYRKEGQEWHDLNEEQEVYRITKWQPLPEV